MIRQEQNRTPFFSVIVPVYNRRSLVGAAIESIQRQSFQDIEVILIDDGSTDGSADELKDCGYIVLEQENSGPGVARNFGVSRATGRYIAFLDSDDCWFPWTLKVYAETINEQDEPAFVTGAPCRFSTSPEVKAHADGAPVTTECFPDYLASSDRWRWFGVSSFVVRRDVLLSVGGFALGRVNAEDADLALRLGTAKGFVHICEPPMFGYRVHDGNITTDGRKSRLGLERLIDSERLGLYPGERVRAAERAEIISRHIRPDAVQRARNGEILVALRFYAAVFPEAIRNTRLRFLAGLPLMALWGWIRQPRRRSGNTDS